MDYTLFCARFTGLEIAKLSDASRPTIKQLLFKLRTRIAQLCDASSPFSGEVEVDESSFGGCRVRGKKGRGARGKTIVFGILERHGKVYTDRIDHYLKFFQELLTFIITESQLRPYSHANHVGTRRAESVGWAVPTNSN